MTGPGPGIARTEMSTGEPPSGAARDPLLEAMLRLWVAQGGLKDFPVTGESMAPILSGIERIRARLGPTPVRFGDIVLYYRNDNLIAHRVVGHRSGGYRTRGDAGRGFDPQRVTDKELLGVVTHLLWTDRTLSLDGAGSGLARRTLGMFAWVAGCLRVGPTVDPGSKLPGRLRDATLGPAYRWAMRGVFAVYAWSSQQIRRIGNIARARNSANLLAELRAPDARAPAGPATPTLGAGDWQRVVRGSIRLGQGPTLLTRLRDSGRLAELPSHLQHELETTYYLMALYNTRALADLAALVETMIREGLEPIVLKGGALAGRLYENIALRAVRDLDLLLRPDEIPVAESIMQRLGYTQPFPVERYDSHFHLPPFVPPRGQPRVEIHTGLIRPFFPRQPDLDAMRRRAEPIEVGRVIARALCPEDQVLHCCLHLAFGDQFVRGVKDLADIDALVRRPNRFDGEAFVHEVERQGYGRAAYYALERTRRVFGTPIGDANMSRLRRHRLPWPEHRVLESLAETYLTALPDHQEFFGLARARSMIRLLMAEDRRPRRLAVLAARLLAGGQDKP